MNASAHNAATIGMDFIESYAVPLASAIERLVLNSDPDAANLCKMLQLQAAEYLNQLDCMRGDAEREVSP